MKYQKRYYPESVYGGFTDIDGTIHFYLRVNALLDKNSTVLDVGCGRGAYQDDSCAMRRNLRILKNKCYRVIGIDVDKNAANNPYLDEFLLLDSGRWPLEDTSVNLAVCDAVLEHVQRPEEFFAECRRVLKPGGYLCLRTANSLGYVALMARLVPNRYHSRGWFPTDITHG
jgi:ubiquinone/menaquinone biosynthesis C-methylase UbiE